MKNLLVFILCLFTSPLFAQTWDFLPPSDLDKTVVSIAYIPYVGNIADNCCGSVIKLSTEKKLFIFKDGNKEFVYGEILTCCHLLADDVNYKNDTIKTANGLISIKFNDGTESIAAIVKKNKEKDLMLLRAYCPIETINIEVSGDPKTGDSLTVRGLGGQVYRTIDFSKLRIFKGKLLEHVTQTNFNILDCPYIPGDSGGQIEQGGKLVGVVSGGLDWFNRIDEEKAQYVWPGLYSASENIKKFLEN